MIKKYRVVLFLAFICSQVLGQSHINVIDTNLAATTDVYLSRQGRATVELSTSSYNPQTDSVFISQTEYSCSPVFISNIQVQVFNVSMGLPIVRFSGVTSMLVKDTSDPEVNLVPAHTLYLNSSGFDTLHFNDIDNGSWDSCGISQSGFTVLNKIIYNCSDIGSANTMITVPDDNGNLPTGNVILTVTDTIRPVLSLLSDTFYLDPGTLSASVFFSDIDNGSSDNCSIDSVVLNGSPAALFNCAGLGSQKIVVEAYDQNGNSDIDSITVFIEDTSVITYTVTPVTAYLNDTSVTVSRSQFLGNVAAGCMAPTIAILSDTVFTCADIVSNPQYVKFSLTSSLQSIQDSALITVVDTISPTLQLKSDTLILINGMSTLTVNQIDDQSFDNCGLDSALLNGQQSIVFSCIDTGSQNVVVTLSDIYGNSSVGSVSVFIADTVAPTFATQPVTAYLQSDSIVINRSDYLTVTSGGCYPPSVTILSDTVFYCSDVNANPHYIKFSIVGGVNTFIDSAQITVLDTLPPTLLLQPNTIALNMGLATVGFVDVDNGSSDNCALDSALLNGANQLNFTCSDTGLQNIQVILYDVHGNQSIDSVQVIIADTIQPSYTTVSDTVYLNGDSIVLSRADLFSNIQGTGCFTPSITFLSDTVMRCADALMNSNYIVFDFTAGSFNSVDSVAIVVLDTVNPVLQLEPDTLIILNGMATASFFDIDNGSFDNCGLDSAQLNGGSTISYTCSDLGLQKIGVSLFDLSGNMAMDSVEIYVLDTVSSSYTKTPFTAYLQGDSIAVSTSDILTDVKGGCITPIVQITSDTIFTCTDVALNPHYITFNFVIGSNSILDSVQVTVLDTIKPTLILLSDTVTLQNGMASILFSDIDNGSFDNCSLDSALINGANQIQFTCADVGINTIGVQLYDIHGNLTTDSVIVVVQDSGSAGYVVTPVTTYLDSNTISISRSDFISNIAGTSCDSGMIVITSDSIFDCSDIASNPNYVYFTYTGGGQVINDSVSVTVLDSISPDLVIGADTIAVVNGIATLQFSDINRGSFDNCALDTATLNGASMLSFACTQIGLHRIGVTIYDVNGNSTSDSVDVFVTDTVQPSYTVIPVTAKLQGQTISVARGEYLQNMIGGCIIPFVSILSDTTFTCTDISTNPNYIKFSITSGIINIVDSAAITVVDTILPTLALKSDTVFLTTSTVNISFANVNDGSFDNCALDSATLNGASSLSFNCNSAGANKLFVQLYDESGNVSSDSVVVYIQDTVTPTYTKVPFTGFITGNAISISRSDVLTNVDGGCSTPFFSFTSDSIFDCADATTNPNYLHFSITNGLQVLNDSVQITVYDTINPTVSIKPPPVLALGLDGTRTLAWNDVLANYPTDNCSIDTIQIVPPVITCNNTGGYVPVLISVFDEAGNFTNRSSFVLATDVSPPVVVTKLDTVCLDSLTGTVTINYQDVTDTVYDACGLNTVTLSQSTFGCQDTGLVTLNVLATDINNNTNTIPASIYVKDKSAPVFDVVGLTQVYLDASGVALINYSDFNIPFAFDNCQITDTVLSKSQFACNDLGLDSVEISLIDNSGNASSKYGHVFVNDTISPNMVTLAVTIPIDTATGTAVVLFNDVVTTLTDNCIIDSTSRGLSKSVFSCSDLGVNTIFAFASDVSGNQVVKSVQVTITASTLSTGTIKGPSEVCGNSYYTEYSVVNGNAGSKFDWTITGGQILNSVNNGLKIYVYWDKDTVNEGSLFFKEDNPNLCVDAYSDTLIVSKTGLAPDTTSVVWWNAQAKTTLVSTATDVSHYRWGYSSYDNNAGVWIPTYLSAEIKNSYYDPDLGYDVDVLDYRYWCETSYDGSCWTRSYHNRMNPIGLVELGAGDLAIQPNPFKDYLTIKADRNIERIQIYDLTGAVVYSQAFNAQQEIKLNELAHLPPSTYMMQVRYENGNESNHKINRVQ